MIKMFSENLKYTFHNRHYCPLISGLPIIPLIAILILILFDTLIKASLYLMLNIHGIDSACIKQVQ